MALQKTTSNIEYIKWSDLEEGELITGYYVESKPSTNFPDSTNHFLEGEDGQRFGLNGTATLDRDFEQIKPGWYVQIEYQGKVVLDKGKNKGKSCHQFETLFDDEKIRPGLVKEVQNTDEIPF